MSEQIEEIKYNRNALQAEITRLASCGCEVNAEEARHMQGSLEDLDSMGAPDAAYVPLLARAQSL